MALFSFSGTVPTDLGVTDGRLKSCPDTPNCVCSYTPDDDKEHAIAPFTYTGSAKEAIDKLKQIIEGMERSKINTVSDDYLYAEFSSKLMGFDRGVTVAGGLPIPVATPAHGTAFDIAGRNRANVGATRAAFDLLARMAKSHRMARAAAA